jgi:peptidoglycan hydrolase-like protein with peptidoglycan-binding domain
MPPRKRTAAKKTTTAKKTTAPRKTAAKKTAEAPLEPTAPAFPLGSEGYLATSALPGNATNRGGVVVRVRKRLGLQAGAVFDDETRNALMVWQREQNMDVTGVVTRDVWDALFSAPATGGVDGADEGNPAPELDTPEGPQ